MSLLDGLMGYWDFMEGGGPVARDVTGNGNDLTLANGFSGGPTPALPTWTRTPIGAGGGLTFTNSVAETPQVAGTSIDFDGPFAVSTWVYPTANSATSFNAIANRCAEPSDLFAWALWLGSGSSAMYVIADNGALNTTVGVSPGWALNTWQNVIFTGGLNNFQIFLNGQPVGTLASSIGSVSGSKIFRIGCSPNNVNENFTGSMTEIGVWRAKFDQGKALELFNGGQGLTYPFNVRRMGRPLFNRGVIVP